MLIVCHMRFVVSPCKMHLYIFCFTFSFILGIMSTLYDVHPVVIPLFYGKQELLELGDRIGYVSTGLKEEEIGRCLRNIKHSLVNDLSPHFTKQVDRKCSICQVSL